MCGRMTDSAYFVTWDDCMSIIEQFSGSSWIILNFNYWFGKFYRKSFKLIVESCNGDLYAVCFNNTNHWNTIKVDIIKISHCFCDFDVLGALKV